MNIKQSKDYFNTSPVEYTLRTPSTNDLKEDREYMPKFSFKSIKDFQNVPVNEPVKPTEELIIKAINYGMIFLVSYKGAKDTKQFGSERVIYPMVLGKSSKGDLLLRVWHLSGWSVSNKRHIHKIWRLFRFDRILSITFTGSFYRLPPNGYNMNDKGMRGGIIAKADFSQIRRNQQSLVKQNYLQNRDEVELGGDNRNFAVIKAKPTDTKLDLNNVLDNAYINKVKDSELLKITFLKSVYGDKYVALLGAMGEKGNTVKILNDKNTNIGVFKVIDSTNGKILKSIKSVKGNNTYDLYIFDKKI